MPRMTRLHLAARALPTGPLAAAWDMPAASPSGAVPAAPPPGALPAAAGVAPTPLAASSPGAAPPSVPAGAAADPGVVRRILILDAQGNRNRFDFEDASQPPSIPSAEFQLSPPPGTDVKHH